MRVFRHQYPLDTHVRDVVLTTGGVVAGMNADADDGAGSLELRAEDGALVARFPATSRYGAHDHAVAADDGRRVIAVGTQATAILDGATLEVVAELPATTPVTSAPLGTASPDGALALFHGRGVTTMWDLRRGTALWTTSVHAAGPVAARFLRDGRVLTWQFALGDGEVHRTFAWDARTGAAHFDVAGKHQVVVDAHERWLVTVDNPAREGEVVVVVTELATGAPRGRVEGHRDYLRPVALDAAGRLATACNGDLLQLHHLA